MVYGGTRRASVELRVKEMIHPKMGPVSRGHPVGFWADQAPGWRADLRANNIMKSNVTAVSPGSASNAKLVMCLAFGLIRIALRIAASSSLEAYH